MFERAVRDEINAVLEGKKSIRRSAESKEFADLKNSLNYILEDIARTGDGFSYDWKSLKALIIFRTREVLYNMQNLFPDCRNTPVENFDALLDAVTQLFQNFEEK